MGFVIILLCLLVVLSHSSVVGIDISAHLDILCVKMCSFIGVLHVFHGAIVTPVVGWTFVGVAIVITQLKL